MKRPLLLISLFFYCIYLAKAQTFTIPDANFSAYLNANYPAIMSGSDLDIVAAAGITTPINCANLNITDLSGIEYFTSIDKLFCQNNDLTSLDVSGNTLLVYLNCDQNQITSISGLSGLNMLEDISARFNKITDFSDLSGLTLLKRIWLANNPISNFPSFSGFPDLVDVNMGFHNTINWSIDLSSCPDLELFRCKNAHVSSISGFSFTNKLRILDLSNNELTDLSELDGIGSLESIIISGNSLSSLPNISACVDLEWLNCGHNPMDPWVLDLRNFGNLVLLDAKETNLDSVFGFENLSSLVSLDLSGNQLVALDGLESCALLESLIISSNNLVRLPDFSGFQHLKKVQMRDNRLDFSDHNEVLIIDQLSSLTIFEYDRQKKFYVSAMERISCVGQTVTFSIASQSGADYYQWFFEGSPIANAFDTTLSISIDDTSEFGSYYCKSYGSTLDYPADMRFAPGLYEFQSESFTLLESEVPCNGNCKEGKVEICHIPPGNPDSMHTLCVSAKSVEAHLAHGDRLGPCSVETSMPREAYVYNSPNPFSGETTINYYLPEETGVHIQIVDMKGNVEIDYDLGIQAAGTQKILYKPETSGVFMVIITMDNGMVITTRMIARRP